MTCSVRVCAEPMAHKKTVNVLTCLGVCVQPMALKKTVGCVNPIGARALDCSGV